MFNVFHIYVPFFGIINSFPFRFLNSPTFKDVLDEFGSLSSSTSTSPSSSRSLSFDDEYDDTGLHRDSRTSTTRIRGDLDKGIKEMLEGLKGNSLQRSMSENSEVDQLDEKEKLAKNHVEQILDDIIERVLTWEEMRQMNSI